MNLVEFIKQYALDHYNDGGWDVVVECWSDKDIADVLAGIDTEADALDAFRFVEVWADRQADARNSAF